MPTWAACRCWGCEGSSLRTPCNPERWEQHGSSLQRAAEHSERFRGKSIGEFILETCNKTNSRDSDEDKKNATKTKAAFLTQQKGRRNQSLFVSLIDGPDNAPPHWPTALSDPHVIPASLQLLCQKGSLSRRCKTDWRCPGVDGLNWASSVWTG